MTAADLALPRRRARSRRRAHRALDEDLGGRTASTSRRRDHPARAVSTAQVVARADGVVAGLPVVGAGLRRGRAPARGRPHRRSSSAPRDGDRVRRGRRRSPTGGPDPGAARRRADRCSTCVCRLSGIATHTRQWADALEGTGATVLDTRKTTPGLRALEKYAVRAGGGTNKRMGLYDVGDDQGQPQARRRLADARRTGGAAAVPRRAGAGGGHHGRRGAGGGRGGCAVPDVRQHARRPAARDGRGGARHAASEVEIEATGGLTLDVRPRVRRHRRRLPLRRRAHALLARSSTSPSTSSSRRDEADRPPRRPVGRCGAVCRAGYPLRVSETPADRPPPTPDDRPPRADAGASREARAAAGGGQAGLPGGGAAHPHPRSRCASSGATSRPARRPRTSSAWPAASSSSATPASCASPPSRRAIGTRLQVMLSLAEVGEEALADWKADVDLGDHVFVQGRVISQPARRAVGHGRRRWEMASKALRPLPVLHKELSEEARVRQRYADLIVRQEARDMVRTRAAVRRRPSATPSRSAGSSRSRRRCCSSSTAAPRPGRSTPT